MLERLQACPGVIRLLECYEDATSVQIVTELCPGGDLQKFVEVGRGGGMCARRKRGRVRHEPGVRSFAWPCMASHALSRAWPPYAHAHAQTYGPLDEPSLALVAFEVLKIVKSCHDMGILHGDVKPANFCLKDVKRNLFQNKQSSNLRAIDFGCSQFLGG
jgi:calcium/calmodulin-dependent protein kinase I